MCGIAGIAFASRATLPDLRARLAAMNAAMVHRGPDDGDIYESPHGRAGLANRRLAIRDLSPLGRMPMTREGISITFNGEIYNADELRTELESRGGVFHSHGDTEVVLLGYCMWGESVVERLRGIFAFCILDSRAGTRLFLARDRLGVKPLYYANTGDAFLFASELNGLRASGLVDDDISPVGLVGYLLLGSVPNPWTIYRHMHAMEPGTTMTVALDLSVPSIKTCRYWSVPGEERAEVQGLTTLDELEPLLVDAVRTQLVSDAPLGAFLSGGLDSSAVVALMRRSTDGPIRTCSMVFSEVEYTEARYARVMAESIQAEHYERTITPTDMERELPRILEAMDQPTVDGVNTYFVSQTAREAGLTVALSGVGGDELFGGYRNTFGGVPKMLRVLQLTGSVPGGRAIARRAIGTIPSARGVTRVQDALMRPASVASAYLTRRGLFAPQEVRSLVAPEIWHEAMEHFDPVSYVADRAGEMDSREFSWVSRAELGTYTANQLLRDTDVMSMAHSLEVRVPFLDHRLVEHVLRLPDAVKRNSGTPKSLLLDAMGSDLPDLVRHRSTKQGFTFPIEPWLRTSLRHTVHSLLDDAQGGSCLQPASVARVWHAFQGGRVHWSRPWALAALSPFVRAGEGA